MQQNWQTSDDSNSDDEDIDVVKTNQGNKLLFVWCDYFFDLMG